MAKIFVMLLGEVDYTDILSDNVVNSAKVPGTSNLYVPLPVLSYILFILFVLSVSIVLMNLLVVTVPIISSILDGAIKRKKERLQIPKADLLVIHLNSAAGD